MTCLCALLATFALIAAPAIGQDSIVVGHSTRVPLKTDVLVETLDLSAEDAVPATVDVVLSTSLGDITIALETERAPITAANFLRYVEEGRFDGTVFYRALGPKGENPSGLIQGGTQFDQERILDPIAHEPTSETGLSHINGALSMARYEPGTATGDFSIMVGDQRGLDARPNSDVEDQRLGYAVFGYVTDGMDVVKAIHAAPVDPDKGEGWMKGQMLAEPVVITEAKRVTSESEPPEPAL